MVWQPQIPVAVTIAVVPVVAPAVLIQVTSLVQIMENFHIFAHLSSSRLVLTVFASEKDK